MAVIYVYFKDNVDIYFARQLVSERIASVLAELPETEEPPKLGPILHGDPRCTPRLSDIFRCERLPAIWLQMQRFSKNNTYVLTWHLTFTLASMLYVNLENTIGCISNVIMYARCHDLCIYTRI